MIDSLKYLLHQHPGTQVIHSNVSPYKLPLFRPISLIYSTERIVEQQARYSRDTHESKVGVAWRM